MITNDQDCAATTERLVALHRWLEQKRQTDRPEEFEAATSGYRLEVQRMQAEIQGYLQRPGADYPEPEEEEEEELEPEPEDEEEEEEEENPQTSDL